MNEEKEFKKFLISFFESMRETLKEKNSINEIQSNLLYTIYELKEFVESRWESWMNWGNYGKYDRNTWDDNDHKTWKWNLDHIKPQCIFPFESMDEDNFKKCWALSNLRPYSAKQNLLDGARRRKTEE